MFWTERFRLTDFQNIDVVDKIVHNPAYAQSPNNPSRKRGSDPWGVTEEGGPDRLPFSLRAKKTEVLRLLAAGCSKRKAARLMAVSLSSVKRWATAQSSDTLEPCPRLAD